MLITTIIPTFNRVGLLRKAVASVHAQTYPNIELIVVDDGSQDETQVQFSNFPHVRYIRHPETRGVSAARNTGIAAARGEWIAFLDSDDLWLPEKIEKQVAFFKEHPEFLIAQTEEIWIRRGLRVNPKKIHRKYAGDIFDRSLERCLISPSAVIIKKELFNEVGLFDETFPACEDYDLWLRITQKFQVGLLDEFLTVKRGGHSDQLSNQHSLDHYRVRALLKLLDAGTLSGDQRALALEELRKKSRIFIAGCLRRGKTAGALRAQLEKYHKELLAHA